MKFAIVESESIGDLWLRFLVLLTGHDPNDEISKYIKINTTSTQSSCNSKHRDGADILAGKFQISIHVIKSHTYSTFATLDILN